MTLLSRNWGSELKFLSKLKIDILSPWILSLSISSPPKKLLTLPHELRVTVIKIID